MTKRIGQISLAIFAAFALLLLPGLAAAALGNGNGSGTQGKSESNPDGGGVDKPYPADGQPAESQGPDYFDGNNGCGQDKKSGEARETGTERPGWDDNNGWCGKPPFAGKQRGNAAAAGASRGFRGGAGDIDVGGGAILGGAGGSIGAGDNLVGSAGAAKTPTVVLGASFTRDSVPNSTAVLGATFERGQVMAVTGLGVIGTLLAGLSMIALGALMIFRRPISAKT